MTITIVTAETYEDLKASMIANCNAPGYYSDNHIFRLCIETHLHPREVAHEIDTLVATGRNLVIGTLTATVINYIGLLVWRGVLSPADITITVVFHDGHSELCVYDVAGFIINWPSGFYSF